MNSLFMMPNNHSHFILQVLASVISLTATGALADGPLSPEESLKALEPAEGLEATLFASEPMITNPTNIAIDGRGRVWVCDVMNYRHNNGSRPEGDRILILEDTDGDGSADKSTVFYQGSDIDSAMGIVVLGERVIVSASPNVFVFYDDDGDGVADRKEVLYSKTGISQHDHAAHAFVFGPDGMLYWNVGNEHDGVFNADGDVIVDVFGREVRPDGKHYRQGMAFRCDLDGRGNFEVLAHNLRNSYELAVDAFGGVWFSDNDDDGNRGVRICYTLEGGNYGYLDEKTGEGWRSERTGMSDDVPTRHWHQNDPGVVPNMLMTGSGSPSGIMVYEGDLLPERYRGNLIHAEPGHNVVRCYVPIPDGAGYQAEILPLLDGRKDQFFRPCDVAAAPDGSIFVADWYDPGVGGHRQGDIENGRIYRVAPKGAPYKVPRLDVSSTEGAIAALTNPAIAFQYAGYAALSDIGKAAREAILELTKNEKPQNRARAYWMLGKLWRGGKIVTDALEDPDERVRLAALRMARCLEPVGYQARLIATSVTDKSPQIRREAAIALRHYPRAENVSHTWTVLAHKAAQDSKIDRWQLEALGLAAEGHWDECLENWDEVGGNRARFAEFGRKLIWRSRGSTTFDRLVELLSDPETPEDELLPLLRALDFAPIESDDQADGLLTQLATQAAELPPDRRLLIGVEALRRLRAQELDEVQRGIASQLAVSMPRDRSYIQFVQRFRLADHYAHILADVIQSDTDRAGNARTIGFLLREGFVSPLRELVDAGGNEATLLIQMLARSAEPKAIEILMPIVFEQSLDIELRREAVRGLVGFLPATLIMVHAAEDGQLDEPILVALYYALQTTPWEEPLARVAKLIPEQPASESSNLPIAEWMKIRGDAGRGAQWFAAKGECASCHKVGDVGKEVGPPLSEIGSKLSRTGLYEAILFPSAAISHNYEQYVAMTDDGTAISGVLQGQTDDIVRLITDKAVVHELRRENLDHLEKSPVSLMPEGVHRLLNPQELADLVAYLSTLRATE